LPNANPSFDLAHITGWIFDLDTTIYPAKSGIFPQVVTRITDYLAQRFNISIDEAFAMRKSLSEDYGTTGCGLMKKYGMEPEDFLSYVHDIDLSEIKYDEELDQAIGRLPGKKVIFTNGTEKHAKRILKAYKIDHHFDYCYDIIRAGHRPKPTDVIYDDMLAKTDIDPRTAVMFEDAAINLKPAHNREITTILLDHNWEGAQTLTTHPEPHIDYIAHDLKSFFRSLT
jgi:putative hydrolase of the HAD superfamily